MVRSVTRAQTRKVPLPEAAMITRLSFLFILTLVAAAGFGAGVQAQNATAEDFLELDDSGMSGEDAPPQPSPISSESGGTSALPAPAPSDNGAAPQLLPSVQADSVQPPARLQMEAQTA